MPLIDVGEEGIGYHRRHRVNTDARDQPQGQKSTHCLPVRTVGKRGVAGDHGITYISPLTFLFDHKVQYFSKRNSLGPIALTSIAGDHSIKFTLGKVLERTNHRKIMPFLIMLGSSSSIIFIFGVKDQSSALWRYECLWRGVSYGVNHRWLNSPLGKFERQFP